MIQKQELEKFDDLKEEYGEKYVEFLKSIAEDKQLSYEDVLSKIPSSEIIKQDEEYIKKVPIARVLMGIDAPQSYILSYYSLIDGLKEDDEEQLFYFISKSEGKRLAPFSKQEFLESIRKKSERSKQLIRK